LPGLRIDIVADIVCPWSFIGVRRLQRALIAENRDDEREYQIFWRPYLLNPDVGPEGVADLDVLSRTIGPESRVKRLQETLKRAAHDVGIDFCFDDMTFLPFAVPAHRLIRQFDGTSRVLDVADRLFSLYFEQGNDISNVDILCDAVADFGVGKADVEDAVRISIRDRESVVLDDSETHRLGINGVPSFIFAGEHVISGAHDQAVLGRMLDVASVVSEGPLSPI